jgi:serine/threonine protein kinase
VHRDLKTENVLITGDYNAKLIDMGIACDTGSIARLVAGYLAPEICAGKRIGPEADCWGLGLILHQTYQKQWKLLDAEGGRVKMRPGMPSAKVKMEKNLQEAMNGLLTLDVKSRWTLDKLATTLKKTEGGKEGWIQMVGEKGDQQKFVSRFRAGRPPLTAFAAYISEKRTHIIGKTIGDIQIGSKTGAVILLVDYNGKVFEQCPSPSTQIKQGCWMYFGVHQSLEEKIEEAVESITKMLSDDRGRKGKDAPLAESSGRVVEGPSELLAFTLEFDSFTFPAHIGQNARLGPKGAGNDAASWLDGHEAPKANDQVMMPGVALDMRNRFKINVAGVLRQGSDEPEWFPGPTVEVSAGDLGIVVRKPNRDGSTESTVTDEELRLLMDKDLFDKAMRSSSGNVLAGA